MSVEQHCRRCCQDYGWCICDRVERLMVSRPLLVLQHPRESRHPLSTVALVKAMVPNLQCRIGLSWANLAATGAKPVDLRQWLLLYPLSLPRLLTVAEQQQTAVVLDKHGRTFVPGQSLGILVLDGSWQQVKNLWWRNRWLHGCQRLLLGVGQPSMYGRTRAVPRMGAQSTLEAIAAAWDALGEPAASGQLLRRVMRTWLQRRRDCVALNVKAWL